MTYTDLIKSNFTYIKDVHVTNAAFKYAIPKHKEELFSQVLEKVWRYRDHFKDSSSDAFRRWCYRITYRTAIDIRRKESSTMKYRWDSIDVELFDDMLSSCTDTVNHLPCEESDRKVVLDYINVTYGHVAILITRLLAEGYTYKETSETLKINRGTVWKRMHDIKVQIERLHDRYL